MFNSQHDRPAAVRGTAAVLFAAMFMVGIMGAMDPSHAQRGHTPEPGQAPAEAGQDVEHMEIEEKLGEQLSRDIELVAEDGSTITTGELIDKDKPVILNMVYYDCPMICNLILEGLQRGVSDLEWNAGDEYEIVSVSIDPREDHELASERKEGYLEDIDMEGVHDGWHFLTGEEEQVRRLADEVGFNYRWNEQTQEYQHGAALIFLSADGMISRYIHGVDYPELTLRNALYDAADGKIGSTMEQVMLYCYEYDPNTGSYAPAAMNIMTIGAVLSAVLLGLFLGILWLKDRNSKKHNHTAE